MYFLLSTFLLLRPVFHSTNSGESSFSCKTTLSFLSILQTVSPLTNFWPHMWLSDHLCSIVMAFCNLITLKNSSCHSLIFLNILFAPMVKIDGYGPITQLELRADAQISFSEVISYSILETYCLKLDLRRIKVCGMGPSETWSLMYS